MSVLYYSNSIVKFNKWTGIPSISNHWDQENERMIGQIPYFDNPPDVAGASEEGKEGLPLVALLAPEEYADLFEQQIAADMAIHLEEETGVQAQGLLPPKIPSKPRPGCLVWEAYAVWGWKLSSHIASNRRVYYTNDWVIIGYRAKQVWDSNCR